MLDMHGNLQDPFVVNDPIKFSKIWFIVSSKEFLRLTCWVKDVTKSVKDANNILVSFPWKISPFSDLVICVFIRSIDFLCFLFFM